MFDIEEWFEDGTGLKIKELRYLKTPPLPFNIFFDDIEYKGADIKNNIIKHNCVIEHYSESTDAPEEKEQEHKIEDLIDSKNWKYTKEREWLSEEKFWVTIYSFEFLEKVRKGE